MFVCSADREVAWPVVPATSSRQLYRHLSRNCHMLLVPMYHATSCLLVPMYRAVIAYASRTTYRVPLAAVYRASYRVHLAVTCRVTWCVRLPPLYRASYPFVLHLKLWNP